MLAPDESLPLSTALGAVCFDCLRRIHPASIPESQQPPATRSAVVRTLDVGGLCAVSHVREEASRNYAISGAGAALPDAVWEARGKSLPATPSVKSRSARSCREASAPAASVQRPRRGPGILCSS